MKEIFKGLKRGLAGLFSDYRFADKKELSQEVGKEPVKSIEEKSQEIAKVVKSLIPKKTATSVFKKRFDLDTPIRYTAEVSVKAKYRKRFEKDWEALGKALVPKKLNKEQKAFVAFLENVKENATDLYASRVEIKKVSDKVGHGLFAKEAIKKGTVICNYAGELCIHDEAKEHGYYFGFGGSAFDAWVIDPQTKGNYAQFMNHASLRSKKCNVDVELFFWDGLPHVFFIASERIEAGDQLLYDYGDEYWEEIGFKPTRC